MNSRTVLKGKLWTARKIDGVYIFSIVNQSSIVDAITDFVAQNGVEAGSIIGLGAVSDVTLRFFDPKTKKYTDKIFNEQMEVTNLTGNISTMNGKTYLHLHITLGDSNYRAYAGHLLDGHIRGAGEFYITPAQAVVNRKFSEQIGINLYDFET